MRLRIINATVWTGRRGPDGTTVVSDALHVADGRLTCLGESARRMPAEEVLDAEGGFLGPAFADGHCHPILGGLQAAFAPVQEAADPRAIAQAVGSWARAHPDEPWVRGEGFDPALAPGGVFRADWLDAEVPDRPVALRASDYHTVWVNSVALERAGYTRGVTQPPDGEIVLDDDGYPCGTLREWGAWRPVYDLLPPVPEATRVAGLRQATADFAAHGIAWVQDAWAEPGDVGTWLSALPDLPVDADLALWVDPASWPTQLPGFVADRQRVAADGGGRLTATTVKIFADGVVEGGTAALLEPYCDCAHSRGLPNWTPAELTAAVTALDDAGFGIHVHAIGDAAIRMTLDAFESVRRTGRPGPRRWTIAHAQVVDPAEIVRFGELGVMANLEPLWAMDDACQSLLTTPRLGPRRSRLQYPMASLLRTGADLSFGSDWPISSAAPLEGIRTAVTRQAERGGEPWIPEERIDVEAALRAYTQGVARQSGRADAGVLHPGAVADLVWLDRDPRAVDPWEIGEISVRGTWRAGTRTHGG